MSNNSEAEDICEASIELYGSQATILNDCNRQTECIQVVSKELDQYGKPIVVYVYATSDGGTEVTDHREIIGELPISASSDTKDPEDVAAAVDYCAKYRANLKGSYAVLVEYDRVMGENVDLYA